MDRKKLTESLFSESCTKPRLKGGFEFLRYEFKSLFHNVEKIDPRIYGFESLKDEFESKVHKFKNNVHNE